MQANRIYKATGGETQSGCALFRYLTSNTMGVSFPTEELRSTFGRWYVGFDTDAREQEEPYAA
jgi:hypothetical protein